jgi:hypothetical protein
MTKITFLLFFALFFTCCLSPQSIQKGTGTAGVNAGTSRSFEPAENINALEPGSFTLMIKRKDYGLSETKLILDLSKGSEIASKDFTEESFRVVDTKKSGDGIQDIRGVSVTDRQGYELKTGHYVTINLDFVMDPDLVTAGNYVVTLNEDLGNFKKGTRFIQKGRTIRR